MSDILEDGDLTLVKLQMVLQHIMPVVLSFNLLRQVTRLRLIILLASNEYGEFECLVIVLEILLDFS